MFLDPPRRAACAFQGREWWRLGCGSGEEARGWGGVGLCGLRAGRALALLLRLLLLRGCSVGGSGGWITGARGLITGYAPQCACSIPPHPRQALPALATPTASPPRLMSSVTPRFCRHARRHLRAPGFERGRVSGRSAPHVPRSIKCSQHRVQLRLPSRPVATPPAPQAQVPAR